jgi:tetratricopeptide (TPR) repeat protein
MKSLAAVAAAWSLLLVSGCRPAPPPLPDLPSFEYQNARSIAKFREVDRLAREDRGSSERTGELGMLYQAYQFLDPARRCYAIARGLAPDEYRWVYYGAMLEKTAFNYEASEALFLKAIEMRPDEAELPAELGDLYLMWGRRDDADENLSKALELDPLQPTAALGKARLLTMEQKWTDVVSLLTPILVPYPRLSKAHQYLAAAYGALDMDAECTYHQALGVYGDAVESPLMHELNELTLGAILDGDPGPGAELLTQKCGRCHNSERIYDQKQDHLWWTRTVRRMQREAGWQWLTDDQAASIAAYLAERTKTVSGASQEH